VGKSTSSITKPNPGTKTFSATNGCTIAAADSNAKRQPVANNDADSKPGRESVAIARS
jgi:hypothetical protein